jgi:hypothetical protein
LNKKNAINLGQDSAKISSRVTVCTFHPIILLCI